MKKLTILGATIITPLMGFVATFVGLSCLRADFIALSIIYICITILVCLMLYALYYNLFENEKGFKNLKIIIELGAILNIASLVAPYFAYSLLGVREVLLSWFIVLVLYLVLLTVYFIRKSTN